MTIFNELVEIEEKSLTAAMCIIVRNQGSTPRRVGSKMIVYPDGRIVGTIGGGEMESRVRSEAITAMQDGRARFLEYNMVDPANGDPGVCGGTLEVYVEPISPSPVLVVVGMGHVGKELVHLAHRLDFRVVITDDRDGFCTPDEFPNTDERYTIPIEEFADNFDITVKTYIVLTTRGGEVDVAGLPSLLKSQAAYIGIIGSKRRWAITRNLLIEKGVSKKKLSQVHSPIGLNLGAENPAEIAVSIMAEILMLQHGGDGKSMFDS
ncbi:MAG: XdhC family protein [Chloroflexi bacterium]|nr:XdhC family protein [Chloroflexota bacterium]